MNKNYYNTIIDKYIEYRLKDPRFEFDVTNINLINEAFNNCKEIEYNHEALIINPPRKPENMFDSKESDTFMINLWNIIFPDFNITSINDVKPRASEIIEILDRKYPSGINMTEKELIQYITAHSASSFIGIQLESKSKFSLNSMKKTLLAHSQFNVKEKPWLIKNLEDSKNYITFNRLMDKSYGDVCLFAKSSRTSIPNEHRNFRDYVFETCLEDIYKNCLSEKDFPPFLISAGKRNDRRGKFRLICSFHANVRILDFVINNGSYDLCSHNGLYAKYTTEGLSGMLLWQEMARMSFRDASSSMVCLDFKGYDSQISLQEYCDLATFLNQYRINKDDVFSNVFNWFINWLKQPKFLLSEGLNGSKEVLIPYYRTLASGLHGTHSFENLIGISYAREAEIRGIPIKLFKANGDDQNIMTERSKINDLMDFTSEYFDVEYSKSLIDHQLTVWGKKWFTRAVYPVIEIGTIRSIWEREAGSSTFVEPSKLESNYCKIISLIIFLFRLGIEESIIKNLMIELCTEVGIKHDRLPKSIQTLKQIKSDSLMKNSVPVGLETCKKYLSEMTIDMNLVGARNVYNLLRGMYDQRVFFDLNVDDIQYHDESVELSIESNFNYAVNFDENIPWMLRDIKIYRFTEVQNFVRSVLQGTNSYDGPSNKSYTFKDMYSLSMAIHERNLEIWKEIQSKM